MTIVGVKCKTTDCPNIIALQEYGEAPEDAENNLAAENPFIVKCETCDKSHSYAHDDLSLFES